jgi:hypothetical protein
MTLRSMVICKAATAFGYKRARKSRRNEERQLWEEGDQNDELEVEECGDLVFTQT